ncbi:MAG: stage II sporulation protein R [Clostridia bacterium]|nr:stage II sporulation protein R [Clostridia bacterium]
MKQSTIIGALLVVFLGIAALLGVCEIISKEVSGGIVRLHVIANSNSQHDQAVKLSVRDEILRISRELSDGKAAGLSFAKMHEDLLVKTANLVLKERNCDYTCRIEMGNFFFPTRKYASLTLPAGNYNAVRIILGEGKGENWWCVMYPPLCFTQNAAGALTKEQHEQLSKTLGETGYRLATEESIVLKPAFKAVEIWENVKQRFTKKR